MRNKATLPTRTLRTRLLLTVVGSAVAGMARALTDWILDPWG